MWLRCGNLGSAQLWKRRCGRSGSWPGGHCPFLVAAPQQLPRAVDRSPPGALGAPGGCPASAGPRTQGPLRSLRVVCWEALVLLEIMLLLAAAPLAGDCFGGHLIFVLWPEDLPAGREVPAGEACAVRPLSLLCSFALLVHGTLGARVTAVSGASSFPHELMASLGGPVYTGLQKSGHATTGARQAV